MRTSIRPCVWVRRGEKRISVPTIGPEHDDAEIINFPFQHYHADWRYCTRKALSWLATTWDIEDGWHVGALLAGAMASTVIRIGDKDNQTDGVIHMRRCHLNPITKDWPAALHFDGETVTPDPWKSRRPVDLPKFWPRRLGEAYASHRINPAHPVCPHRGAPLCGITPDADGIITCPAHGLRWDAATGEARPRTRE